MANLSGNVAINAFAVTPHNTNLLAVDAGNPTSKGVFRLFVGGSGTVKVKMAGGEDVTFSGVVAGSELNVLVTQVFATGTTATLILALTVS